MRNDAMRTEHKENPVYKNLNGKVFLHGLTYSVSTEDLSMLAVVIQSERSVLTEQVVITK